MDSDVLALRIFAIIASGCCLYTLLSLLSH